MITKAQAAKVMGMKEREVTDVQPRGGGGYVVTTFDGQQTELKPGGGTAPIARPKPGTAPAPAEVADTADTPPPAEQPRKATRGARGRGRGKAAEQPAAGEQPTDVYPADAGEAERLAWVGDRADRAAAAVEFETGRDEPDQALIERLQAVAG